MIRILNERDNFARLVDQLPHAIEAGCADLAIAWLKWWGAWHHLYPVDRAAQAMAHSYEAFRAAVDKTGGPVDSEWPHSRLRAG